MKFLKTLKIWQLVLGLFLVIGGATLFVVGVSGGFGNLRAVIDAEYVCSDNCENRYMELSSSEYEKLVAEKKSFVVLVDKGGCNTADRLREFVNNWATKNELKVYKMDFSDMKETSLHDTVKYYPSVAVVSKGKVVGYMRADSDDDAPAYNEYEAFVKWIENYLKK